MSSSILASPEVRRQVAPLDVAAYHALGEYSVNGRRTELIRGFIVEKTSKSPRHTSILRALFALVQAAARAGLLVAKEDPLTLADSEPEPDISVVAGTEEDFREAHPSTALFVVEVAVSTEQLDRAKAALYAEAGVPEYWLVLPERGQIEVYTLPQAGHYTVQRVFTRGEVLAAAALPGLRVSLADLFGG